MGTSYLPLIIERSNLDLLYVFKFYLLCSDEPHTKPEDSVNSEYPYADPQPHTTHPAEAGAGRAEVPRAPRGVSIMIVRFVVDALSLCTVVSTCTCCCG